MGAILRQANENLSPTFRYTTEMPENKDFQSMDPARVLHNTDEHIMVSGFEIKSCHGPGNSLPRVILPEYTNNPNRSL